MDFACQETVQQQQRPYCTDVVPRAADSDLLKKQKASNCAVVRLVAVGHVIAA